MKFGTWLTYFKDVDLPIGDLAKDMISANDLEKFNSITSIDNIPFSLSGPALETIINAFNYYSAEFSEQ